MSVAMQHLLERADDGVVARHRWRRAGRRPRMEWVRKPSRSRAAPRRPCRGARPPAGSAQEDEQTSSVTARRLRAAGRPRRGTTRPSGRRRYASANNTKKSARPDSRVTANSPRVASALPAPAAKRPPTERRSSQRDRRVRAAATLIRRLPLTRVERYTTARAAMLTARVMANSTRPDAMSARRPSGPPRRTWWRCWRRWCCRPAR